ncbi:MAG: sigma-70 family RNA polymerase sigma factor [Actinomycetota bacterium]|jgi:RNA polymerase sigma-70 factor (ECF subfamily)|nr:sigma-70 family RNA polymerase sigma factor [Actinomycetota bacterium]
MNVGAPGVADVPAGTDDGEGLLVEFVRGEYPVLVAALGLVCGSRPAAEDAVQEALARAVVAERRGKHIESLPAWVRVVALNLLRNRWRSLARERVALHRLGRSAAADGDGERAREDLLDLRNGIAGLPRRQREAVALHYRLGLNVAETAVAMGVTDGTVKTLLSRARQVLATAVGDQEDIRA